MAEAEPSETHLRLVYSLLKPAVAMASRFRVPMRAVSELLRLAYFESLRREGLSQAEIAERLGQSERHMRSLQRRLNENFFAAEKDIGLVREVENAIAARRPSRRALERAVPGWEREEVNAALATLLAEERVLERDGCLEIAPRYVLLKSERFHHRIDALNHFLGGVTRAVSQRLVEDEAQTAMVKTISLTALPEGFRDFLRQLEGWLRVEVARLEESVQFEGREGRRYVVALAAAEEDGPDADEPS